MTMAAKFAVFCVVACLIVSGTRAHHSSSSGDSSSGSSGSYSSDESVHARLEARLHRCVRFASPGLVVPVDGFAELAKVEKCAVEGMIALYDHKPPAAVNDQIQACVDSKSFPPAVMKSVNLFKACVKRALL